MIGTWQAVPPGAARKREVRGEVSEMSDTRHPTTAQLHAAAEALYQTSLNWPYPVGVADYLVPGAAHEVALVQVAYDSVVRPARERRPFRRQGSERWYIHRVTGRLWLLGREMTQVQLFDVLASEWEKWSR
jgi:hypothetical protein